MSFLGRVRAAAANGLTRLAKVLGGYMDPNTGWFLMDSSSVTDASGKYTIPAPPKSLLDEYQTGAWVFSSVSIKARAVASLPWLLKRVVKNGPDEVVTDHPVVKLLERPMPKKTFVQLVEAWITYKELSGTAFIEKVRRSKNTVPVGLVPLRSDRVSRKVEADEGVYEYVYRANAAREEAFRPEDVIDDSYFNPLTPDGGLAPTLPAWVMIQMDKAATSWNWDFFRNGAQPDVILSSEKPVPIEIMSRIKADLEAKNRNAVSRGRGVHFVPYGVRVDQTSTTHREMQFERLLTMDRSAIAAVYGVPPVLLGLETLNYATADVQLRVFRDWKALPLFRSFLDVLTIEVVEEFPDGEDLYLCVDEEAVKTADERAAEAAAVIQDYSAGIIDRPEARVKRGYPADPDDPAEGAGGRDREAAAPTSDEESGAPAGGGSVAAKKPEQVAQEEGAAQAGAKPSAPTEKRGKRPRSRASARPRTPYQLEKARAPERARIERRVQVEATKRLVLQRGRVESAVKRELHKSAGTNETGMAGGANGSNGTTTHDGASDDEDGHARAVDVEVDPSAARLALAKADEPAPKLDLSEEDILKLIAAPIAEQFRRAVEDAVRAGGGSAADALGVEFDATDKGVVERYEKQVTHLEEVLDPATARMVKDTLAAGHRDGDSEVDLMRRIRKSGEFSPSRAMRIARTETHLAMQAGHFEAFKQAGVATVTWITAMDSAVRDIHRSMHGQERPLGEPFEDGDGNELLYPGDPDAPPESIVNCRCGTAALQGVSAPGDLADALDLLPSSGDDEDVDDDVEERISDAVEAIPEQVAGRVDPDDLKPLRYEVVEDGDDAKGVEYDPATRVLSIGVDAPEEDVEDAVLEYLVSTTMGRADARGVRNQLVAASVVTPDQWGDLVGTELQRAIRLVAAATRANRARVEDLLDRDIDDDEWEVVRIIASHFLAVGRSRGKVPHLTNPK